MSSLRPEDPLAQEVVQAIKHGSDAELRALLDEHPGLAWRRLVGGSPSVWDGRTLLHAVTDWPGHVADAGAKGACWISERMARKSSTRQASSPTAPPPTHRPARRGLPPLDARPHAAEATADGPAAAAAGLKTTRR